MGGLGLSAGLPFAYICRIWGSGFPHIKVDQLTALDLVKSVNYSFTFIAPLLIQLHVLYRGPPMSRKVRECGRGANIMC